MGVGPLTVELIGTFVAASFMLYRYGDWKKNHVLVTLSVLVAWYFSLIIVVILPLDVSSVRHIHIYALVLCFFSQ